jgi:4-amino-4-deoxy-L-arabinose transferase-like glycosyltransferase
VLEILRALSAPEMKPINRLSSTWRQLPLLPLILIVAINTTSFLLYARVNGAVGADTGTDGYKEIAENVVQGHGLVFSPGMPSTMMLGYMKREPIYPLWLSGILAVTGTLTPGVLCLFQTSLCMISCCLLYRLGAKIFDVRTGGPASYIYALHPISFWYSTRFASEIVAVPVLLLCLLIIDRFFTESTRLRALQAGLLLGVAALTKSAYIVLLPLVLLFAAARSRQKIQQFLPCALIVVLSFAGIHSLWLLRNYAISREIVPFTTMTGVIFFVGNRIVEQFDVKKQTAGAEPDEWAEALYQSVQADTAAKHPNMSLPRLEAQTDQQLRAMAGQLVLRKPLFVLRKVLAGMVFIWFVSDTTAKSLAWAAFQVPLLALAIIGVYRQRQWSLSKEFLLCFVTVFLLAYALESPYARYATAVAPVVMLFASYGLMSSLKLSASLKVAATWQKSAETTTMSLPAT